MIKRIFSHEKLSQFDLNESIPLSPEEINHLKVRRFKKGDTVEVLDGQGNIAQAHFDGKRFIFERILNTHSLKNPKIHLFIGQINFQSWEWLLEKCAELGVFHIHPFISEFVETKWVEKAEKKQTRLQRFLIDAIKQTGQPFLPQLSQPRALDDLIQQYRGPPLNGKHLIALEPGTAPELTPSHLPKPDSAPGHLGLWIGPEGGWSPKDIQPLKKLDPQWISFSNTTFRAETAALFFMSNILYSTSNGNL